MVICIAKGMSPPNKMIYQQTLPLHKNMTLFTKIQILDNFFGACHYIRRYRAA